MKFLNQSIVVCILNCPILVSAQTATFETTVEFDSPYTGSANVTLYCNGGLPLSQSAELSPDETITFSVMELYGASCRVEQESINDFSTTYLADGTDLSDVFCEFSEIFGGHYVCLITNMKTANTKDPKMKGDAIYGYEVIDQYGFIPGFTSDEIVEARCNEGKKVLGGGWTLLSGGALQTMGNGPSPDSGGYYLRVGSLTEEPIEILVTATCAYVAKKSK